MKLDDRYKVADRTHGLFVFVPSTRNIRIGLLNVFVQRTCQSLPNLKLLGVLDVPLRTVHSTTLGRTSPLSLWWEGQILNRAATKLSSGVLCILCAVSKGLGFPISSILKSQTYYPAGNCLDHAPPPPFSRDQLSSFYSHTMLCSVWCSQIHLFCYLFRSRISVFSPGWMSGVYYLNPTFPKPFSHSATLDPHFHLLRLGWNFYFLSGVNL